MAVTSNEPHLQWYCGNIDADCSTKNMDLAAANAVKWFRGHRPEGCTTDAMDEAAGNGFLEFVKG